MKTVSTRSSTHHKFCQFHLFSLLLPPQRDTKGPASNPEVALNFLSCYHSGQRFEPLVKGSARFRLGQIWETFLAFLGIWPNLNRAEPLTKGSNL
jgi:hypothetical protein